MKHLALNLIDELPLQDALDHSFKHFHARGVSYVNLLRTPALTVKLYITEPGIQHPVRGWLVGPHNHRYNFETHVLAGCMVNTLFSETQQGGMICTRFDYATPLTGGSGFTNPRPVNLVSTISKFLDRGDAYYLTTDQVHTISVAKHERTVLLLLQYADGPQATTRFYSPTNQPPETSGLYQRFTAPEITALIDSARTDIEASSPSH